MVDGKNFRLADEVRYILGRAAEHDLRIVTIGQIILLSTETGDAWLLPHRTTFTIDWKGRYCIEGAAFVYPDHETG
jgi:hypothetical protein